MSDGVISTQQNFEGKFTEMLHNYDKIQYIMYQQYIFKEIIMVETLIKSIPSDDIMYEQILRKGTGHNEFLTSYIKEKHLTDISTNFLKQLDAFHLSLITDLFLKALRNNQQASIISILKMYKSMHAYSVAESMYRKNFLQPVLDKIFYHEVKNNDGDQLTHIFEDTLKVLENEVSELHKLIEM